jgi:hypothetical protein
MPSQTKISIAEAVAQALSDVQGPISVIEFVEKVLTIRPSSAKNPAASIKNHLRWDANGKSIVYLDSKTIVPLQSAMRGVRFRVPLTRQEVKHGVLLTHPALMGFVNVWRGESVQWADEQGNPLPAQPTAIVRKQATLQETHTRELPGIDLGAWMKARRARQDDHVLVTIESWEPKRLQIELESAKSYRQHRDEVARQNQELADALYDALENTSYEQIWLSQAIPAAYLNLSDPHGYPGDHWYEVVTRDPRMRFSGNEITYADRFSPLERLLGAETASPQTKQSLSPEQEQQVYRFKASLKYNTGLWRRIEIQGGQTLWHFDETLRDAFNHDSMDHLSGFWHLHRRGKGKRYREVEIGDINPFGEGDGADITIAELELEAGNRLKYVYDFGDWIEHTIELEAIEPPDQEAEYPRPVARNKPRYRHCESCRASGKETVATWICIDCSERQGRAVLVCEDCLASQHEEHYADEVLY